VHWKWTLWFSIKFTIYICPVNQLLPNAILSDCLRLSACLPIHNRRQWRMKLRNSCCIRHETGCGVQAYEALEMVDALFFYISLRFWFITNFLQNTVLEIGSFSKVDPKVCNICYCKAVPCSRNFGKIVTQKSHYTDLKKLNAFFQLSEKVDFLGVVAILSTLRHFVDTGFEGPPIKRPSATWPFILCYYLSAYMLICLSVFLFFSFCLPVCLSICLSHLVCL